jgi:GNAT superfamily N-acetyltransferase
VWPATTRWQPPASSSPRCPTLFASGCRAYPVPAILLARLATDVTVRGLGLGSALLVDAGQRASRLANEAGVRFLEVVAKDVAAREFYQQHGATPLLDDPHHLVFDVRVFRG